MNNGADSIIIMITVIVMTMIILLGKGSKWHETKLSQKPHPYLHRYGN